jgi:hypothetical protein
MNLQQLAIKYKTDKHDHGYMPFYEKHLPDNPKKILEIGVHHGNSIRMWKEYFPNTEIHGLDLFSELDPPANLPDVIWHKGNQCDWLLLEKLRNENFDVIIDDGSHNSRDQMITFFGLFNGNHYFVEDTHCAEEEFYRQGLPIEFSVKMFSEVNDIITRGNNIILFRC